MANPESFVSPRRGGGTGAAAILQPSTALNDIFKTYDAQHKAPDDPFLDSLGADIRKGADGFVGIYEPDRPAIAKARDELTALQAKAFMSKTSYAKHPEVYQAIDNKKQELKDLVSKSQRTRAIDEKTTTEFQNNGHKYDDAQKKNYEEWRTQPIETRSALPDVRPLDSANYQAIAKKWGAKNQQGYYSIANYKDQSGVTRSGYVFNENLARDNWDQLVKSEAGTQDMQRWFGHATDVAKDQFEKDGVKWDEVPEEVQLKAIDAEAEDMYVESMRMQTPSRETKSSTINTTEPKQGAKPQDVAKRFTIETLVTPSGNARGVKKQAVLNLVGILGKDKDSAVQSWIGETNNGTTENIVGRAQRIIQEEGKPAYVEISVSDPDGNTSFKYAPYFRNKDKVVTDYGVDFEKDRPKDWSTRWANAKASYPLQKKEESPEVYQQRLKLFKPVVDEYNSKKASVVKSSESTPNKWSSYKRK
jgi:hypothetical protein